MSSWLGSRSFSLLVWQKAESIDTSILIIMNDELGAVRSSKTKIVERHENPPKHVNPFILSHIRLTPWITRAFSCNRLVFWTCGEASSIINTSLFSFGSIIPSCHTGSNQLLMRICLGFGRNNDSSGVAHKSHEAPTATSPVVKNDQWKAVVQQRMKKMQSRRN